MCRTGQEDLPISCWKPSTLARLGAEDQGVASAILQHQAQDYFILVLTWLEFQAPNEFLFSV